MANPHALEHVVDAYLYRVRLDPDGLTLVGRDHFDTMAPFETPHETGEPGWDG